MKAHPKRTLLAWLLTAAMLLSLLPSAALAASGETGEEETTAEALTTETVTAQGYQLADDSEAATSGTCGDNLTWALEDGVLTISGTGEMYNYSTSPWYDLRELITSVVIGDGVTSMNRGAFFDCSNLSSVSFGAGLTTISKSAFSDCPSLKEVTIPDTVTTIESFAFYGGYLTSITIPASVTEIGLYALDFKEIEAEDEKGSEVAGNLTIYGYSDTVAYLYAAVYDIPFVSSGTSGMMRSFSSAVTAGII